MPYPQGRADGDEPPTIVYEIRVEGHLGPEWAEWFDGMTIRSEANGESSLTGSVVDQAALHGILKRMRDLGLPLVSVVRVTASTAAPGVDG